MYVAFDMKRNPRIFESFREQKEASSNSKLNPLLRMRVRFEYLKVRACAYRRRVDSRVHGLTYRS